MNIILIFAGVLLSGISIVYIFKKYLPDSFYLPYVYLLGSLVSLPILYLIRSYFVSNLQMSIYVWAVLILFFFFFSIRLKPSINELSHNRLKYVIFLFVAIFFFIVFNKTFSYEDLNFLISTNMYLDMGAHIPFIRSFSTDSNFPFQIPFYANSNIPYHFMFDFYTGLLEYAGLRIDIAYNVISALVVASFAFVLIDFGKSFFNRALIGILAFIIFLLPFNFSFFKTLESGPLALWRAQVYDFSSFLGEYTAGNFLSLNVYINQRHLIFALALAVIFTMIIFRLVEFKKNSALLNVLFGLMLSTMYLWNVPVFVSCAVLVLFTSAVNEKWKLIFTVLGSCGIFTILFSIPYIDSKTTNIQFLPGYLMYENLTLSRFLLFWFINLGFVIPAVVGGFYISNKEQKILFLCLLIIFLIPNLFKFSHDMFDNHKFFNFVYLFMSFYAAYFLHFLYTKKIYFKFIAVTFFVVIVFTSLPGIAVIKNDIYANIPDYKSYKLFEYAEKKLDKNSIVLTNGEIYDPASVSGVKTYVGRSHYIFLYGGDPAERTQQRIKYLNTKNTSNLPNVGYIIIYKDNLVKNKLDVNRERFEGQYKKIYEDGFGIIYKI